MFNKLKLLFLLCLCAQKAFALNDASGFLVIPSPSVLGDKSFQARGTLGYHHVTPEDRFPFVGSFRYGIFDSFDLGLLFGSTVSLDVKNQLVQPNGATPAVAVGARAFVESPEAYFYSVPTKSERKKQTGEFYTSLGWDSDWWNIIGGVSAFPTMDADAVAPFWGFEQKFGSKFSIIYEGFFRHGYTHHNGAFLLKPVKSLQISAGATEFYRFLLTEDGDFKFRTKNENASNGYRTPGIYLSIAITGLLGEPKNKDCKCDSANAKTDTSKIDTNAIDSAAYRSDILREFEEIVKGYFVTDLDLDSLLAREKAFMDKGLMSKSFVLSEAQNKSSETNKRITAIRIMSHFPDSIFIEPLGGIIEDPSNEAVAREAVLALGTINTPEARNMLSAVASKTSGIINKTIMDILGEL